VLGGHSDSDFSVDKGPPAIGFGQEQGRERRSASHGLACGKSGVAKEKGGNRVGAWWQLTYFIADVEA
jgi:hypothetical protein